MANDLTAYAVGLQVEYVPDASLLAHSAGLQVDYSPDGSLKAEGVGLQVEYSEELRRMAIRAVGLQVEYAVFALGSVTPQTVPEAGGTPMTILGTFTVGEAYTITIDGEPCYSGVLGNGYSPVCETAGQLDVVSPPLVPGGGPYTLTAVEQSTSFEASLSGGQGVSVEHSSYTDVVFNLRGAAAPPRYTGPIVLDDEDIN